MIMETNTTPKSYHPDRVLYERAYREGLGLVLAGIGITTTLEAIRYRIDQTRPDAIPDMSVVVKQIISDLEQVISVADQQPETNLTDLFRARTQLAFVEQRVMAPFVFSHPRHYDLRHELNNSAYGLNHHLIEDALAINSLPVLARETKANLRGIINEQTFFCLVNRKIHTDAMVTPADTADDIARKTDAVYWHIPKDGRDHRFRDAYAANVQVKSSRRYASLRATPRNGFIITGEEMGNDGNEFNTARLIARELSGVDFTDEDKGELDTIHAQFMVTFHERLNRAPGVLLAS